MIKLSEYRQKPMENFDAAVEKMLLLSKTECSINALQNTIDAEELNSKIITECQLKNKNKLMYSYTDLHARRSQQKEELALSELALLSYQAAWIIVIKPS